MTEQYLGETPADHAKNNGHALKKITRKGKQWQVCVDCAYEEPNTPRDTTLP